MTSRLSLISHAATSAVRASAFPADEPVDAHGQKSLARLTCPAGDWATCWTSPASRAIETAAALGLAAIEEPALRECDYGRWTGLTLDAIQAKDPGALQAWLANPSYDGHGGESIDGLIRRVGFWLDRQRERPGKSVAITHASVIRAALVHAMDAGSSSFWRIDITPLCLVDLVGAAGRWNLIFLGRLREREGRGTG